MRVSVYVDGFNLYNRALKFGKDPATGRRVPGQHKWLDLQKLATTILDPHHVVTCIRYFTARVKGLPWDRTAPDRQHVYLRALDTLPCLEIHYGFFRRNEVELELVNPPSVGSRSARVLKTEEKGSDVNLASYLLLDGFQDRYDAAAVITNDSDQVEPIRLVKEVLQKHVIVFDPSSTISNELRAVASGYKPLRQGPIAASQFPPSMTDARGPFVKPPTW